VFLQGTRASTNEAAPLIRANFDPAIRLTEQAGGVTLQVNLDKAWGTEQTRKLVTTALLGKAKIPDLPYENADGSPIRIATDYFGARRNAENPFPGPFEVREGGQQTFVVWPVMAP
jgi:alpha-N-arabinofuranosidase